MSSAASLEMVPCLLQRSLYVRRSYETQTKQFSCECVYIFLIPRFPNSQGDDENQSIIGVHPIDNPISLSNNAEAPIACKLPDERFALFRRLFRQAINRFLKLHLNPAVSNIS